MSGGILNHDYHRIADMADKIRDLSSDPLHQRFADHLDQVAKAAHDLEWVLSGDYSSGAEVGAITAALSRTN